MKHQTCNVSHIHLSKAFLVGTMKSCIEIFFAELTKWHQGHVNICVRKSIQFPSFKWSEVFHELPEKTISSSMVVTSVHSSAMMLKKGCLIKPLEWRLSHPCSKNIHTQTLLQPFLRFTLHFLQLCQGKSLHHNSLPILPMVKVSGMCNVLIS